MSYRSIANEFSLKIVAGRYSDAFEMLSGEAREVWSPSSLQEAYIDMIEYFEGSEAKVIEDWDDEFAETKLEEGTLVYVPINSQDGDSEAISVVIGSNNKILEVEFGRP